MSIQIQNVCKSYNELSVLDDVSLTISDGEFISLIGPSGVGKTTLLRILASLDHQDSGKIVFSEPPGKENPVLMVFQNFALFPHMSVIDNVAYGLKVRGVKKNPRKSRAKTMMNYFGISEKAMDYPSSLSAGQRQRAAIARALIVEPMVLLLDEPFANLDKNLKGETAVFIRETQKSFGTTTIMVTHDQEEAFSVSDRVGVLIGGTLRQYDSPENLLQNPSDSETAGFLGKTIDGNIDNN